MTRNLVILGGLLQFAIVLASLGIPRALRWKEKTQSLDPLTKSIFWTYAAYIFSINLSMAALSTFAPDLLIEPTPLARWVCGFIAVYWGARLLIQFASFGKHRPKGALYFWGEAFFVLLFAALTGIYTYRLCCGEGV